jgi:hypothetical protein
MQYLLGNDVPFHGQRLRVAKVIDDSQFDVPELLRAGAILVELPNPDLEARAEKIRDLQRDGQDDAIREAAFKSAVVASISAVNSPTNGQVLSWNSALQQYQWVTVGGPSAGAPIFVWDSATAWSDLYTAISAFDAAVVIVPDGPREMTPNPLGDTDLSSVVFVGLKTVSGGVPTINIDSLMAGGFSLPSATPNITSKDIDWTCRYRIATPVGDLCWTFEGGGFRLVAGLDAMRVPYPRVTLRDRAYFKGHAGANGVFATIIDGTVEVVSGSSVGPKAFHGYAGPPPAALKVNADATAIVDPAFVTNVPSITLNLMAQSSLVGYDNSVSGLSATEVQAAIDELASKAMLALTTAQRLALTPTTGQAVWDTDTRRLYVWQGSWVRV